MAGAAADDVDLAVDDAAEGVIARHRHRVAALPLVRGGVVHLVRAEHASGSIPETKSGQVLVLIEQPGEASKLVTMPEMASSGPAEALADKFKAAVSPASKGTRPPPRQPANSR